MQAYNFFQPLTLLLEQNHIHTLECRIVQCLLLGRHSSLTNEMNTEKWQYTILRLGFKRSGKFPQFSRTSTTQHQKNLPHKAIIPSDRDLKSWGNAIFTHSLESSELDCP